MFTNVFSISLDGGPSQPPKQSSSKEKKFWSEGSFLEKSPSEAL